MSYTKCITTEWPNFMFILSTNDFESNLRSQVMKVNIIYKLAILQPLKGESNIVEVIVL